MKTLISIWTTTSAAPPCLRRVVKTIYTDAPKWKAAKAIGQLLKRVLDLEAAEVAVTGKTGSTGNTGKLRQVVQFVTRGQALASRTQASSPP